MENAPLPIGKSHLTTPMIMGQTPSSIGRRLQAQDNQKKVTGKTLVPLFLGERTKTALELAANHALRMFEINPKGFRRNKDGTSPFIMGKFVAAGLTKDTKEPSDRAKRKRLLLGIHLLKMKENPKQHWSNWMRNHNGEPRAAAA